METSQLRSLYARPGRFVTVYASADPVQENAALLYDLRWQDILDALERQGVEAGVRQALVAARGDSHAREGGIRTIVAAGAGKAVDVPFAQWLPGRSDVDLVAVGALPHLLPVIDWADRRTPHVIALVDRLGVDVLAYTDMLMPAKEFSQDTTRPPWHKAHAGGWAQRRYESHVEDHWRHGAKESANLIIRAARDTRAEVVILAGDPKALSLVRAELPVEVGIRVVVVQGSRGRDGSADHLADRVAAVLTEQATRRTAGLAADFHRYRSRALSPAGAARGLTAAPGTGSAGSAGSGGRPALDAADGPAATVEALRLARVSHLLLAEGIPADEPAWIGPREASEISLDPAGITGDGEPVRVALVDGLIRAALGTGAAVHSVPAAAPESPVGAVGALLRYPLPASA